MDYIIIGIIIACFAIWALSGIIKIVAKIIGKLLKWGIVLSLIIGFLYLLVNYFVLTIVILLSFITICLLINNSNEKKKRAKLAQYINQEAPFFTPELLCDKLKPSIHKLEENDRNNRDIYIDQIPFGRANAFLSYFGTTVYDDEPIYYSPIRSLKEDELREYGTCITDKGFYFSRQINDSEKHSNELYIPFSGIYQVVFNKNSDQISSVDVIYTDDKKITITPIDTKIQLEALFNVLQNIIDMKIPLAYLKNQVVSENEIEFVVQEAENKLNDYLKNRNISKSASHAGMVVNHVERMKEINEIKNYINGIQGHGYAAEYANNTIDKLLGKKPINEAANLENGHQRKNGADRIVNGRSIQTKYCQTARDTVNAAFKGEYIENGRMMQIEVPRDQYQEALQIMQEKIDNGEVPGAQKGESAKNYVRKGYVTLAQAHNIASSGTLDGLIIDTIDGAVMSVQGASITALVVFASSIWQGETHAEAAKQSLKTFAIVVGKGTFSWVVVNQLTRTKGAFGLVGRSLNIVADQISSSKIATSKIGDILGLQKLTSKTLLNNAMTAIVVFGPDICYSISGKISLKQLFKNSVISGTSIAAAAFTGAKVSAATGNVVGAIAGTVVGVAAGKLSKSIMDNFIEDDAKEMFQILKEEFIDIVMLSNLTQEEFDEVCQITLLNSSLSKQLRNMFGAYDSRLYARNELVSKAVSRVISKREYIDYDTYSNSIVDAIEVDFSEI